jgi:hypothetical protein
LPQALLVALGSATIDLVWILKPAVEPTQRVAFHWSGNARGLYLAAALDVVVLALLLLPLLWIARKPGRPRVAIWSALLLYLPWTLYIDFDVLKHHAPDHKLSVLLWWSAFAAILWLVARWRPVPAPNFDRFVAGGATVLSFAGAFGIFLLLSATRYGWQASRLDKQPSSLHAQVSAQRSPHRVIWIVFDELSYDQLYDHRYPGLQMPAFDALAAQSTVFTQVVPVDIQTEVVLPALMTGEPVDDIRTSPSAKFLMHNSHTQQWQPFDEHQTVFQDALDAGYSTGVAGWYNPYCRVVKDVLDRCTWTDRMPISNGMNTSDTVLHNMVGPLNVLWTLITTACPCRVPPAVAFHRWPGSGFNQAEIHAQEFKEVFAAATDLVDDPGTEFILLHLPVPHPLGIYDRSTGAVKPAGSYIDNLSLADKCLADIRHSLEERRQWDSSAVVIMGDHSWRTKQFWYLRRIGANWTQEDNKASDGGAYDPRPAYIVKLPGQTTGARIDTTYHAVNTRRLFDVLLNRKIQTPADLAAWAQAAH